LEYEPFGAKVPPPTRRSTPAVGQRIDRRSGSSAHAEIDPIPAPYCWPVMRFLRPRGDRPSLTRAMHFPVAVPPPTRRSTPPRSRGRLPAGGSSAHAEIDPRISAAIPSNAWFLRPRGDRPKAYIPAHVTQLVPPPTRRSTQECQP